MLSFDNSSLAIYFLTGVTLIHFLRTAFSSRNLRSIPTVGGPSAPLLSYISAYNYIYNAAAILQEGYDKYKGCTFKIPMLDRWLVVITGPMLIDEVQRLSDDQASFVEASAELSSLKYIFGPQMQKNPYHVTVVRQQLTRQLVTIFPNVIDEIATAFKEFIPAQPDEWIRVSAPFAMRQIVARTSNRVFLGLPYCRDPAYLELVNNVTVEISKGRLFIDLFPPFLKPLAAKVITDMDRRVRACIECLQKPIHDRLRDTEKSADALTEKPNDMLQWLIEEERKTGKIDVNNIVKMLLLINFAAIHTSSTSFTHALYHLAANPEYMLHLREEVEAIIEGEGWTKAAMGKMRKLDSFMRESQRINGINGVSMKRKILQDVTFSDGTCLPAGTIMVTPATATHMDEENYTDPHVFDPWRFSNIREKDGEELKHQFVNTSVDYVSFGLGRHACPGRFFAANELKAMMAHVVMNYDVKFENEGVRPPNKWFGLSLVPDPTARVLFRKRRD